MSSCGPSPRHGLAPIDPLRLSAVRLLLRWHKGNGYIRDLLEDFESGSPGGQAELGPIDRRRLRELVFGCVRLRGRYDHILKKTAARGPEPVVRVTLWLGLHELCELSTPNHAVVSQSVGLIKELGLAHAAGFVNGVLRRVIREGPLSFFPSAEEDPIAHAVSWLSHPRWIVERWAERISTSQVLALCEAGNRRPSLVLRAEHGHRDDLLRAAAGLNWEAHAGQWAQDAVILDTRVPASLALHQLGPKVAIQDEAAQLVPQLLALEDPGLVLDLCAAPGGKAAQLSALLGPRSLVVGVDLQPSRLRRLEETRHRLDLEGLFSLAADGTEPPFRPSSFDAVLVDVPCSGTGVFARRHEARWRRRPKDLLELPVLQKKLLDSAVELCAPGGIIVYATCSLEIEENDEVVDAILAARDDLVEVGAKGRVDDEVLQNGRLRVWPHRHGTDGAFAAVLARRRIDA